MTASYPDAQSPGSRVGPLTLIQAIAQGGEGIVYTARHDTLGDVVVKEFWPKQIVSRARDVSARAAQENWQLAYRDGVAQFIRLGKRLIDLPRHPGLMVALEVFEANNTAYLVTERVEGRTLDTALEAGAFSDPDDIRRLAERLGDAMAHLHRQGLFHRDLAPDNIIITAGFDWHPVLIDFNAAKDIVQKVSRSHDGIVKPGFTAIEQYAIDGKEPIGAWTDIYSASAVLYRCITGEAPADPAVRLLRPSQSPQLTDSHANRFDPAFLRGVEAGLEPHPDNRPQTVAAWLAAMGLTGAEPDVEPAPPPTPPAPTPEPLEAELEVASKLDEPERQPRTRKWLLGSAGLVLAGSLAVYMLWSGATERQAAVAEETPSVVTSEAAATMSPTAGPTADPVAAVLRKPIAGLVQPGDYPKSAIANREQGTTRFQLTVGSDGRVSSCRVTGSSGSAALDKATCALVTARARFAPALGSDGAATTGAFKGELRWKLPQTATTACNRGPFFVYFNWDGSSVTPETASILNMVAKNWSACNNPQVLISGYAGDAESASYAVGFSQRRAQSVSSYLASRGVSAGSISTQGMGKNGAMESGPQGRRVEITFQ